MAVYEAKAGSSALAGCAQREMPRPLITRLEDVVPWEYRTWDRDGDATGDERADGDELRV